MFSVGSLKMKQVNDSNMKSGVEGVDVIDDKDIVMVCIWDVAGVRRARSSSCPSAASKRVKKGGTKEGCCTPMNQGAACSSGGRGTKRTRNIQDEYAHFTSPRAVKKKSPDTITYGCARARGPFAPGGYLSIYGRHVDELDIVPLEDVDVDVPLAEVSLPVVNESLPNIGNNSNDACVVNEIVPNLGNEAKYQDIGDIPENVVENPLVYVAIVNGADANLGHEGDAQVIGNGSVDSGSPSDGGIYSLNSTDYIAQENVSDDGFDPDETILFGPEDNLVFVEGNHAVNGDGGGQIEQNVNLNNANFNALDDDEIVLLGGINPLNVSCSSSLDSVDGNEEFHGGDMSLSVSRSLLEFLGAEEVE